MNIHDVPSRLAPATNPNPTRSGRVTAASAPNTFDKVLRQAVAELAAPRIAPEEFDMHLFGLFMQSVYGDEQKTPSPRSLLVDPDQEKTTTEKSRPATDIVV
ncbi:MAG: hypothetical protein HQL56_02000 [Magnetococcales bacterium]|nr:hypothetical protein [Magnetococcales bacterium]